MHRQETVTFLSARTSWLVTLEICTGLRCSLAPSNDDFYWSLAVLLIFQMISCVNLGKLYPPWYKHNMYIYISMYYIHLCYFFCTKNVEFINTFSICQAGWKRNLSCCLFPIVGSAILFCWPPLQVVPMKDKTMRELKASQKEKDWILQKGCNRNNKLHDFDILVNSISSNSNNLSRWSFTGRGECCSCWNGLKSIHPPRISSISISSLSKQLVFLGIGWLLGCWTLAVSFGVLHHQLLTLRPPWSRGPVKIWSPCVWLSKKHERCDDSRSGIAPLWRWVVEILVNGIGQNWPKQECFI